MNRCASSVGRQYLYHLLHRYNSNPDSLSIHFRPINIFPIIPKQERKFKAYFTVKSDKRIFYFEIIIIRSSCQTEKQHSDSFNQYFIIDHYCDDILRSSIIFVALGLSIVNIFIHSKLTQKYFSFLPDMHSLRMLLKVADQLAKFDESILQVKTLKNVAHH